MTRMYGIKLNNFRHFRKKLFVPLCLCVFVPFFLTSFSSCDKNKKDSANSTLPASVTFAVFGNTGMSTDNGTAFKTLASSLTSLSADFAVDLGNKLPPDSHPEKSEEALDENYAMLQAVTVPVYPVAGAQDIFDYESDTTYSMLYGPMWYSFNRGGAHCIVLNTADDSYRSKFGNSLSLGDEQLNWLMNTLDDLDKKQTVVVFMNRPVWKDAPDIWRTGLLPVFRSGGVDLIISCHEKGLYDWGEIDGIRAVSSGCTGPVKEHGLGLFPHFLLVTLDGGRSSFRVLRADGAVVDGIDMDKSAEDMVNRFVTSLKPQILPSSTSWDVSESVEITLNNPIDATVSGSLSFETYRTTSWDITPRSFDFSLKKGETTTYHMTIRGNAPDLAPLPTYHLTCRVGETTVADFDGVIEREIPLPRTGKRIPVAVQIVESLPYAFDGGTLRVPIEISGPDNNGRLVIYNDGSTEIPICMYVSPLQNFQIGINEFTWNGRDLEGRRVSVDSLSYYVVVYNKKAPPTWVAEGPLSLYGTFSIGETNSGHRAITHTDKELISYRIGASVGFPEPEQLQSFEGLLDGLMIIGTVHDGDDRMFVTTEKGLMCVLLSDGKIRPDRSFGEGGYVTFTDYRGCRVGNPSLAGETVFVGIGGGNDRHPSVLSLDKKTGDITGAKPLDEYFDNNINPPSLAATDRGVYISHPEGGHVMLASHSGELLWLNEPGDLGGDVDVDGRSFTYVIGTDQYGFSYVNTPGTSARCSVLGPDGRALFRVILVILPGLRVSSAIPFLEGKSTDGIYFITRGADKSYVFHVPYTIKAGKIVDETFFFSR